MANWGEIFAKAFSEGYNNAKELKFRREQQASEDTYRNKELDLRKTTADAEQKLKEREITALEKKTQAEEIPTKQNIAAQIDASIQEIAGKNKSFGSAVQDWNSRSAKYPAFLYFFDNDPNKMNSYFINSLKNVYAEKALREQRNKNMWAGIYAASPIMNASRIFADWWYKKQSGQ